MASPNRIGEIAGVAAAICILSFSFAAAQRSLQKQLGPEYKKWLTEDVRWIIRDEERRDFWKLVTDDQRREFVDEFWARRNPSPKSQENPFKEEHYRRLAYANEHFAAAVAGRKTDRGRIYIVYGPPDTVRSIAGDGQKYPSEVWHYNHMKGGGDDVSLEFVDTCWCGEYPIATEPPNREWDK